MEGKEKDIFSGWMWSMFKEYVRKITRTASSGAMKEELMQARYQKMFRDFEIKTMASDKVGMIIQFLDLEDFKYQDLEAIQSESDFMSFLSERYGLGKFKVNLYYEGSFIATKNFKIETGEEKWRPLVKDNAGLPASATPKNDLDRL